jgi:hypothetical protein
VALELLLIFEMSEVGGWTCVTKSQETEGPGWTSTDLIDTLVQGSSALKFYRTFVPQRRM